MRDSEDPAVLSPAHPKADANNAGSDDEDVVFVVLIVLIVLVVLVVVPRGPEGGSLVTGNSGDATVRPTAGMSGSGCVLFDWFCFIFIFVSIGNEGRNGVHDDVVLGNGGMDVIGGSDGMDGRDGIDGNDGNDGMESKDGIEGGSDANGLIVSLPPPHRLLRPDCPEIDGNLVRAMVISGSGISGTESVELIELIGLGAIGPVGITSKCPVYRCSAQSVCSKFRRHRANVC